MAEYVPVALRALDLVAAGHRGEPQVLANGTFYHRIGLADTRIDWRDGTTHNYNLVRGQSDPFLNAWTVHEGQRLFVKVARPPRRGLLRHSGADRPGGRGRHRGRLRPAR